MNSGALERRERVSDLELSSMLGVSSAAVTLLRSTEVIDLHIEPFLPHRLWGYDLFRRHGKGVFRGYFFGHLDYPRIQEGGLTGGMWSITTNPFRSRKGRWKAFEKNLSRLRRLYEDSDGAFEMVRTWTEYQAARERGAHAAMVVVQGGNAFEGAPRGMASVADDAVVRVTLVHLTNSGYGITSSPLSGFRGRGLTSAGKSFVEDLNANRIFVDLAHINPKGFWDAVEVHDREQPLIVTHTGVDGVRPHWRNLDDRQIKAVADTGGVIGIIYAQQFLKRRGGPRDAEMIVEHMQHVIDVAGEDVVSIGSDYDGAITPPRDLRSGESYAILIQKMLDRNWSEERIRKILGGNFLRSFKQLRP